MPAEHASDRQSGSNTPPGNSPQDSAVTGSGGNTQVKKPRSPIYKGARLVVASSPYIAIDESISSIMGTVLIALVPAAVAGCYLFGFNAVRVIVFSSIFCLVSEALLVKCFHPKQKITTVLLDGSALVTGVLLAFNLPSNSPIWMIAIGALVAMLLGKHVYGGLGQNPFNPALVARVVLLVSFPVQMTSWPKPLQPFWTSAADAVTAATPLGMLKTEGLTRAAAIPLKALILGNIGGCIGEVSVVALTLGGILLIARGIIRWEIPVTYIGTVAVLTTLFWLISPQDFMNPLFHIFSGGLFLGAIFMATDLVTSPLTLPGMAIFGVGCGLITVVIRLFGGYPEGVSFAILIMNGFTPLIDRYCQPRRYGAVQHA